MKNFNPVNYRIFEGIAGSHLYGMATPESDMDTRGVCLPPQRVMLDPFMKFEIQDAFGDEDRTLYSLAKFFALCADNNPNILELLFVPEEYVLYQTKEWSKVVKHRHLFLSKNIKSRFLGYAMSQLKAIERHREWFLNPPPYKPTRDAFGLSQTPLVSEAILQNLASVPNDLIAENVLNELTRERAYREAKRQWDNYQQWVTTRNPKRKGTEEKFGYDTKNACHLFRLMTEGKQLLLEGNITFPLPNADYLLAIKNGALPYEEVLQLAASMADNFDNWYELSTLPDAPDRNALKELYFETIGI